ncbi:hypothetical protein EB837_15350 [Kluyvera ascorbata]|uniref:DUF4276 family protein n=1 Tax=Kluyvera ascorbata TaxID=51288 RepID=A0A3N2RYU4_9ENTR|nr:hypothetical protein [Kluyvera ascorbata]ROU12660.1 hypothetical protein EB837_15350 [Kluyvera ascorbata]
MSDLRIALIAEGPLDYVIINAALTAILGERQFVLTQLQPEQTHPYLGNGWGGVMKWCHAASERHQGCLEDDPTLIDFDLLILHLDVDVSGFNYQQCGDDIVMRSQQLGWLALPCARPCPPASDSAHALADVLRSWLRRAEPGARSILCLPAQSTGAWLAAAVLPPDHVLLQGAECCTELEDRLSSLPLGQRIRKSRRSYIDKMPQLRQNWSQVKTCCAQARCFEQDIHAALQLIGVV